MQDAAGGTGWVNYREVTWLAFCMVWWVTDSRVQMLCVPADNVNSSSSLGEPLPKKPLRHAI